MSSLTTWSACNPTQHTLMHAEANSKFRACSARKYYGVRSYTILISLASVVASLGADSGQICRCSATASSCLEADGLIGTKDLAVVNTCALICVYKSPCICSIYSDCIQGYRYLRTMQKAVSGLQIGAHKPCQHSHCRQPVRVRAAAATEVKAGAAAKRKQLGDSDLQVSRKPHAPVVHLGSRTWRRSRFGCIMRYTCSHSRAL